MPSGGHGGSGGSHFSGDGSSGGSHFSRSGSSSRIASSNSKDIDSTVIYNFLGKKFYITNRKIAILRLLVISFCYLLFFTALFCFVPLDNSAKVAQIEADNARYVEMIEYAFEDSNFLIQGKVNAVHNYYNSNKYCVEYSFVAPSNSDLVIKGYSYYIYTHSEAEDMLLEYASGGFDIALEISKYDIDETNYLGIDSVNVDYIYHPLEDDVEYQHASNKTVSTIFIIIFIATTFATLVAIIFYCKKHFKRVEKDKIPLEDTATINGYIKCQYCGVKIKSGGSKCPNCGGTINNN